jgi:hypothetical protein
MNKKNKGKKEENAQVEKVNLEEDITKYLKLHEEAVQQEELDKEKLKLIKQGHEEKLEKVKKMENIDDVFSVVIDLVCFNIN